MTAAPTDLQPLDLTGLREKYDAWVTRIAANHRGANHRINPERWFTPLAQPLADSRLALVTTAGAHLASQPPFNVATHDGDAGHRLLPDDLDPSELRFTHTHYDTSSAEADPNVVLPLDTLHDLVAEGRVGEASPVHIGMMGFNPDPSLIADRAAPEVAQVLVDHAVDVAIMVPG